MSKNVAVANPEFPSQSCKHGNHPGDCVECLREQIAMLSDIKPETLPQTRISIGRRFERVENLPPGTIVRFEERYFLVLLDGDEKTLVGIPEFKFPKHPDYDLGRYGENQIVEITGFFRITVDGDQK